jgi:hypothetical protein
MAPATLFSICNAVAALSWLVLIVAGRMRRVATLVTGVAVPLLFAIVYTSIVATKWAGSEGGFGSLSDVSRLFSNQWLLLAGWVHYLAFDLFVGSWEVRDAIRNKIPHLAVIPCLILTFLFGPVGLLLYFVLRFALHRNLALSE